MMPSSLESAVQALHGCPARWIESTSVHEEWEGETAWEGEVQVFELEGHPEATRCYAWAHETDEGRERVVAVLHVPPVDSPQAAVRAAIAAEYRGRT